MLHGLLAMAFGMYPGLTQGCGPWGMRRCLHPVLLPPPTGVGSLAPAHTRHQVSGPDRDVHSGNDGGVFDEPMVDLAKLVATFTAPGGRIAVPGFYDQVGAGMAGWVGGGGGCVPWALVQIAAQQVCPVRSKPRHPASRCIYPVVTVVQLYVSHQLSSLVEPVPPITDTYVCVCLLLPPPPTPTPLPLLPPGAPPPHGPGLAGAGAQRGVLPGGVQVGAKGARVGGESGPWGGGNLGPWGGWGGASV